jgi:4-coumarate--CoA ligase
MDTTTNAGPTVFRSPLPTLQIPDLPITALVLAHAARLRDKPAIVDAASGTGLTYGELETRIRATAARLSAAGFGPGRVLAILMPNCPDYAVAFHGATLAGGAVTTINPGYTAREVRAQLLDAGAGWLMTVPALRDLAHEAAAATAVRDVEVFGTGDAPARTVLEPATAPTTALPAGVAALPYSSGTTGLSKGVMLTHRNLVANVLQVNQAIGVGEHDVIMAVLPFFHIYGMQVMMNSGLSVGATLVTMPRFDLELFLRAHAQYRITATYVAPPIVVALAKHPMVAQFDLSSLRFVLSGAAPLSAATAAEAAARVGCPVVQGYGMTELSPVTHFTPPGRDRPGACGMPVANTECRIVDPATGESLGPDRDGELWIRGPQVMAGYLNQPAATAATIDAEGWLHTGDIAHIDTDGYLFVVDRLKELIKYKGFQVPPAELEALLLEHPAVADAAVIGLPDDEAGEIPVAFVVLKAGRQADAAAIQAHVASQVAHYKQLRRVEFVGAIPKSASGKILRRVLRDAATA